MAFQPLPTPFQPYARVYAIVPSNPLPTPVLPYPLTPKGYAHALSGVARPINVIDLVPMPPFLSAGGVAGGSYAFALCGLWTGWLT